MHRRENNFRSFSGAADFARSHATESGTPSVVRRTTPTAGTWSVEYDDGEDEGAYHEEMWELKQLEYDDSKDRIPAEKMRELYGEDYDLGERPASEWGDSDDLDPSDYEDRASEPYPDYD